MEKEQKHRKDQGWKSGRHRRQRIGRGGWPGKPIAPEPEAEVPGRGLEPLLLAEPDPKSGVSANFTTPAPA